MNAGGRRRERRSGGVCCRHAGGREAGCVFVNKGFPVPQFHDRNGARRTVVLVLMMWKRDVRFSRAPAFLPLENRSATSSTLAW